jgi:putative FmdB family regulatory protein
MPLYEYRCSKCRQEFTLLRPMDESSAPAACTACGSTETERLISACAIGTAAIGSGGGFS